MRGKREGRYSPGRGGDEGGDDSSRWLGTYGDAITLLMAFFVMLYAMSEVDAGKFESFVRGLQDPFGNTAASQGLLDGLPAVIGEAGQYTPAPKAPDSDLDVEVELPVPDGDEPGRGTQDIEQLTGVLDSVVSALTEAGLEDLADVRYDGRGLVFSLASDDVLFGTGSTTISELGAELVAAIADGLRGFPNSIFVEGHTDDVPLDRADYSNWNLSTDRAVAVIDLLSQRLGFPEGRLGAAGYADQRPRVPNDSSKHRALNRRVDILIVAETTNG